jgi:hypothetical protein
VSAADRPVLATPAGLRFRVLHGEPAPEELEVLAAALDRLATLERGDRPSPWVTAARPGAGVRAWSPGSRWANSLRGQAPRP